VIIITNAAVVAQPSRDCKEADRAQRQISGTHSLTVAARIGELQLSDRAWSLQQVARAGHRRRVGTAHRGGPLMLFAVGGGHPTPNSLPHKRQLAHCGFDECAFGGDEDLCAGGAFGPFHGGEGDGGVA